MLDLVNANHPENCYHILFREWDSESWELGPVYEVKVDKAVTGTRLGTFLGTTVFPHIPPEYLFCTKISFIRNFKRGDLVVRRWNCLKTQAMMILLSTLEINRDGVFIVVRDYRKKIREELTEEELMKYASNSFMDHLHKKKIKLAGFENRSKDAIFIASQGGYSMGEKALPKMKEKSLKIGIGAPKPKP